ncbi:MAG: apolipoprotein N-acyltransferase [Nitrospiraceae bacterium]|nr:apolipoprotein N-acyltransferase [Nitrospiraceae bacterium]
MRNGGGRYLWAAISGATLVFTFAPFNVYPLAWFALAPFLVALKGLPKGTKAFKAGFLMGFFYFFGTTYWIYHSMHDYGGMGLVSSLFFVVLLASYLALYTGFFGYLFSLKINHTRLPALFVAPVIWVSLEYLRSYMLTGFPWATLGYSQWKFLYIIQMADTTGVYGVSFLIVAVNGAIADLFIMKKKMREMPLFPVSYTMAGYFLLAAFVMLALGYGEFRLTHKGAGLPLRVSVVQGNIDEAEKWNVNRQDHVLDVYEKLTEGALFESPNLIVWPEASLPFPFDENDPRVQQLEKMQNTISVPMLIGAVRQKKDGKYANSAILLDQGKPAFVYDKIHLVPFGEYVPLKRVLFFVNKLSDAVGDLEAGHEYTRGSIRQGDFGVAICYEIAFPGLVRKFFKDGGNFLVTITNDAWFGKSSGPYQNFSMAAFRAVENRKPVIRAANTGISGFFSRSGRLIKKTHMLERRTLTADLKINNRITFYSRFGDLFSYFCILSAISLFIFTGEKEKNYF